MIVIPVWMLEYFQPKEIKVIISRCDAVVDSPALEPIMVMASQGNANCDRFEDLIAIYILYWVTRNQMMDTALRDWSRKHKTSQRERLKTWAMWQKFKTACEGTDDIDKCLRRFKQSL